MSVLSVIIPSRGRPGLERTLASIRAGASPRDVEIIVVGDSHAGTHAPALARAQALALSHQARYVEHDGGQHMVGQPQRNYGMTIADSPWLGFSQDDNVYEPTIWPRVLAELTNPSLPVVPRLYRVFTWQAGCVWKSPVLALGNIDADCIITPNDPARLGTWGEHYNGDWDFIVGTCARFGDYVWADRVLARHRPGAE